MLRVQGDYHAKQEGGAPAEGGRLAGAAAAALAGAEVDRGVQLSCGEHSDYGLLTLVNQDADIPALQVILPAVAPSGGRHNLVVAGSRMRMRDGGPTQTAHDVQVHEAASALPFCR